MDTASWCVSTSGSVETWGLWNKRKQIPPEFLLSKQWGGQWVRAWQGHTRSQSWESSKTFRSVMCISSGGKSAFHRAFLQLCSALFHFFLPCLSCVLPLSYYNLSWFTAMYHLLPAGGITFVNRYLCCSRRLAQGSWKSSVKAVIGVWKLLQHKQGRVLSWNRQKWVGMFTEGGKKECFTSSSAAGPGDLGTDEIYTLGASIANPSEIP